MICRFTPVVVVLLCILMVNSGPMRTSHNKIQVGNNTSIVERLSRDSIPTFVNSISLEQSPRGNTDVTMYETDRPCQDNISSYLPGDVYVRSDDPCMLCICQEHGETCTARNCPPLPDSCIEVHRAPHQCCVTCVKEGCSFKNQTYHVGEYIQVSPCRTCKCETDGIAYCSVADCGPPKCVDPVHHQFNCCPSCPRGSNCIAEGIIIPDEHFVIIPRRCKICRCLYDRGERYWQGSKQAKCTVFQTCRNSSRNRSRLRRSAHRYFNEYIKIAD